MPHATPGIKYFKRYAIRDVSIVMMVVVVVVVAVVMMMTCMRPNEYPGGGAKQWD